MKYFFSCFKCVIKGSTIKDSNECEFDDDCEGELDDDAEEAYVVCTDRRCEFVTGECLEDADCAVRNINAGGNMKCVCCRVASVEGTSACLRREKRQVLGGSAKRRTIVRT